MIIISIFLITACNSNKVNHSSTKETALKTIHIANHIDTMTLDKELTLDWVRLDKDNFNNIFSLLNNQRALADKDLFLKSIIKLDIRETKDLGFGLTYFECAQYGGHVTTWISLLSFENAIIQYDIRYSEDDFKIIAYLINQDAKLKSEIAFVADTTDTYSFYYQDSSAFDKFKSHVASKLGLIKLSPDNTDEKFASNYSILTNPINSYDFGTLCYESGVEPEGRKAINYFTSSNNISAIREIVKGYNPEGRLYAIEALLTAVNKKRTALTDEDNQLIKNILALDIPISACNGCIVSKSTAGDLLDAKLKALIK